jgi:hypothetical protein
MCFAVHNQFVFTPFCPWKIYEMLFCEAVIPTAVPCGEHVRVLLKRPCELGACQFLNVNKSVGINIGGKRYLGLNVRSRDQKKVAASIRILRISSLQFDGFRGALHPRGADNPPRCRFRASAYVQFGTHEATIDKRNDCLLVVDRSQRITPVKAAPTIISE